MFKKASSRYKQTLDVRTIHRVVGLLKTLVKVNFEKKHYRLLVMQKHERYPDKLKREKGETLDSKESELSTSDVIYYSSKDDEDYLETL